MKKFTLSLLVALFVALPTQATVIVTAAANAIPVKTKRSACTVTSPTATNMTFTNVFCWQDGQHLRIEGQAKFTGSGGAGAIFRIQLPTGYVIDTTNIPAGTTVSGGEASSTGYCTEWDDASVTYRTVCPVFYDTSGVQNQVKFEYQGGGDLLDSDIALNDSFNFKIEVPIVGW
jgi:phosphate-selective porin